MKANIIRAIIVTSGLAAVSVGSGCVADRPSRNDVFNENQYLRKDFLIRPGSGGTDPGWFEQTTVTATSVPNPFAGSQAGLGVGTIAGAKYVNFVVTSDQLSMNNMIEPSSLTLNNGYAANIGAQGTRDEETVDSWAVTNVDLKYQVNLDGEKTNFYQENQELDWQLRQWVKVNFDKNDQSDLIAFGDLTNEFMNACADAVDISSTLTPGSFYVDEVNNYWQFAVDVTIPLTFNSITDTTVAGPPGQEATMNSTDVYCTDQFGTEGWNFNQLGRTNVTMTVLYSFMRAPEDPRTSLDGSNVGNQTPALTYMPLVVPEKDAIQHKYLPISQVLPSIDPDTGLWQARQLVARHDPKAKQITYYFGPGFPNEYKTIFGNPDVAGCTDACTFSGGGGALIDQTNALFKAAGAPTKLVVMDYDANLLPGQPPRQFGDVRFSFLEWISDLDNGQSYLAVTSPQPDPRSGQLINTSISMVDTPWRDYVLAQMDFYEQSIGAFNFSPPGTNGVPPEPCVVGTTIPLVPATVAANHNASSTLFAKMQQYLNKPVATYGNLGPSDFIVQQDNDFFNAFYTVVPYEIFQDPATNQFVIPQGGSGNYASSAMQIAAGQGEASFHQLMQSVDTGWQPFGVGDSNGPAESQELLNSLQAAAIAHQQYQYLQFFAHPMRYADDTTMYSLPGAFERDSRHCIASGGAGSGGTWETRSQYISNLLRSYYSIIWWHEFGHSLGMEHNFMGSVDRNNWPHYKDAAGGDHIGLYESSLMDYNINPDRVFWSGTASTAGGVNGQPGWAPYDQAAIAWIYSNSSTSMDSFDSGKATGVVGSSVSGQSGGSLASAASGVTGATVNASNARWNDPFGYCPSSGVTPAGQTCTSGNEIEFLTCSNQHVQYTPFCRTFDYGTTPSEIIAADIDTYEWQYVWRNFPQYHQFYDFRPYANSPQNFFTDARRFMASWTFDWQQGPLSDLLRKLGVQAPSGVPVTTYYNDIQNAFNNDASMSSQLFAATTEGILEQASGERPFITQFDAYYGDTIQQGIQIDKLVALQGFTALWQVTNYNPNVAAGTYLASFSLPIDSSYEGVAEQALLTFIGGFPSFPYAQVLPVQQFAMATQSIDYQTGAVGGRPDMKDWIGGYVFTREEDFLDFFRQLAVQYQLTTSSGQVVCPNVATATAPDPVAACSYNPMTPTAPEDPLADYHSDPFNQFTGPDFRRYIWVYLPDVNDWVVADRDRNVAAWSIMYAYTSDVLYSMDGTAGPFSLEYPIKYMINAYETAGNVNPTPGTSTSTSN